MVLSVLYCGTPHLYLNHEALGNKLLHCYKSVLLKYCYKSVLLNNICFSLRLFEYIRLRLSLKYKYYGVSLARPLIENDSFIYLLIYLSLFTVQPRFNEVQGNGKRAVSYG